jgi:uncharacterized membrane protein YjjP (DUF1212 family)
MLHAWWKTNMDARRSISLLIDVAGWAVVGIGIAASPVSLAFESPYGGALVGAFLGAALGGYLRHRVSDPERAPLWALAYAASVTAFLVAAFVTLVVIRPTVRGIPGLENVWGGVILSGVLVASVGAFLWERDARRRRFGAPALLAAWLIAYGTVAKWSGDPWASFSTPASLSGFGVLLLVFVAFVASRPSSRQDAAKPDTWR